VVENKTSILAVDDDVYVLRMLKRALENDGFSVITASNGEQALNLLTEKYPDLVLLDITMPGIDGYAVCIRLREFSRIPIIMITARGTDEEIVKGLEAGADDYVLKPFSIGPLIARIRATLRRSRAWDSKEEPIFRAGKLVIDFSIHRVLIDEQEIELTATEYRVLSYLAQNANRVLTPDQILSKVWGETYTGENHILQVNIARLRKKIEKDQKAPTHIITRPGIGYVLTTIMENQE
jgi:DNA-binding response OmpR family regulator